MPENDNDAVQNKRNSLNESLINLSRDAVPLNTGERWQFSGANERRDSDHGKGSLRQVRDSIPPPKPKQ